MKKDAEVRASVAMAVCNGERYLDEQIKSILSLLGKRDELVISYNESGDGTWSIIKKYEERDKRIHVISCNERGVENNFNYAVDHCRGRYIFLSDQDDVWIDDKIDRTIQVFRDFPDVRIVISDGYITDESLTISSGLFEYYNTTANAFCNFVKGSYLGCQMAFDSRIKKYVWPVRTSPPLPHDLWLGVCGSHYGRVMLLPEKLILHRLHDSNYSIKSKMSFGAVISNRLLFVGELIRRIKKNRSL